MTVPFVDLRAQYLDIKGEVDAAIQRVIDRNAFVGGEEVRAFQEEFAAYCAVQAGRAAEGERPATHLHCATCGNGTDAIYLTLRALGVGPGDEVITVAHTFIATSEAISMAGARPVFVDVLPGTMLMDPDALEAAVTERTRAVIPVHLYGQPCEMDRIMAVARRHGLKVVEDAAQAHGAYWRGRRVGTLADAATFSFYPGKNLGAYGDAGAVVSQDEDLIRRVRMLANHGRKEKYTHDLEGVNSRLDGLQAAVLRVKLRHLDEWNAARRRHAAYYHEALGGGAVELTAVNPDADPVWHLYVVRVPDRDAFQAVLKERGIETGVHYPVPLHRQPAYGHMEIPEGTLPVTEKAAAEVVSLPMYAELTEELTARVVEAVRARGAERAARG